ncbi:hypothetical protein [Methylocystis bryophila]|uniref:Uncharacterized protein n=1 Tax=Methylocystis bryophila TaxID=655015 RepID=A0A1W6MU23_9HYPH|nr:hypothetical protein [Methylocystis bryophila]ARN81103.1 hypothetical protein B1812_08455 [Methylocystis bryophila]BDV37030.1 hypothetical protein DSM21852_02830 [Methylocystis bryophila]
MLFNIEADRGNQIVGYLVPDDFTKSPTLRVRDSGSVLTEFPCLEERPSLVAAGRHGTGRCGFTVDESTVPSLAQNSGLELYDADTDILIYRRRQTADVTQEKIFRFETHLFPLWRLDEHAEHKFQFFHKGVDRHGRETATQMLQLNNASSIYLSGRVAFKPYENHLHDRFRCIALIQDPYVELAERLLMLKNVPKLSKQVLGPRDVITYRSAIEFSQAVEPDEKSLLRAFDAISKEAIAVLTNPMTRQFAGDSLDEPPPKGAVARALASLSTFSLIGLREDEDLFLDALEALMQLPTGAMPSLHSFSKVQDLAKCLRLVPEAELLLEQDLEVYQTVREAIETAI